MFQKFHPGLLASICLVSLLTSACTKKKSDDEPEATFKGYWIVSDQLERVNHAILENSCTSILQQSDLHPTAETIDLDIMSLWADGSIFALDTIIKKGAKKIQAHANSVTAANIPGRFVDQGTIHLIEDSSPLEGSIVPSEKDNFSLSPFEVEDLEQKILFFILEEPDLLEFTMQSKNDVEENIEPFQLLYNRITVWEYIELVDFSQSCLQGSGT